MIKIKHYGGTEFGGFFKIEQIKEFIEMGASIAPNSKENLKSKHETYLWFDFSVNVDTKLYQDIKKIAKF